MKPKFLFFMFALSLFFVSCNEDESAPKVVFDLEEFQAQRAQWNELNLQNYSYEYSNSGYSYSGTSSHIGIEILNGEKANVSALVENGIQDADKYLIDDLFDEILNRFPDDGFADLSSPSYLKEIRVEYDKDYHFPSEVHYIFQKPEDYLGIWDMHQYIKKFQVKK